MNLDDVLKICREPARLYSKDSDVVNWVRCRKCSLCLNIRHTDIAGRAMAESLVSDHTVALTLTYADWTGARAQHLAYRDVQLMLKRLRKAGYNVRFLVAGEYGSKRGRAHWHCCLFFKGACPPLPPVETQKQHWSFWSEGGQPLGFVFVQKPDFHGLRYVVKYACKDDGSGRSTRKVQMSLKPPLGADYWHDLAEWDISQGKPFSFDYSLPDCRYGNGNPVQFFAQDASARLKWAAYRKRWLSLYPLKTIPIHKDAIGSWMHVIVPVALRQYAKLTRREIKLSINSGAYIKSKVFRGKIALLKIPSGDIVALAYNGPNKELSLWRVRHVQEMVQLARGRLSAVVVQLRFGDNPPF